jgi:sarcosine oxidase, subunit beta
MAAKAPDAIVIGAGVIGCSIALELAKTDREVLVLDAGGGAGAGSTSASSAIIRFHYSTFDAVVTAWEAVHRWSAWSEHLGADDESGLARFHRVGCVILDTPGSNRAQVLALFDQVGVPYEAWTAGELECRLPTLDAGAYWPPVPVDDPAFATSARARLGAYFTPDAGFVDDPMLAAHNLMVAAVARGATFRFHSAVAAIRRVGSRVDGVTLASGEQIDCTALVNAAGPFSSEINRMAGADTDLRIHTRPLRQEVHVIDAPAGFALDDGGTVVNDSDLGTYFRPQPGGTLLLGGMEPECDPLHWVDDPHEFDDRVTVDTWEAQVLRVARRLPTAEIPLRPRGVAAMYDASDDWVPIYDRSALDGLYLACGTSGNQFKNAPMVGRYLTAIIDASERGVDHDATPVTVVGDVTGLTIDLAHYSRLREPAATTGNVLG